MDDRSVQRRTLSVSRPKFASWAALYGLAILYCSVAVGPEGVHFVPLDPVDAWRSFLATPYQSYDPDQRADLIANLFMLVPLGFLVMGAVRAEGGLSRWLADGLALAVCLVFVLALKYAQLFFPPRTVSINYIAAQWLGVLVGAGVFVALSAWRRQLLSAIQAGPRQILLIILWIYAVGLLLFVLFPFNFAVDAQELQSCFAELPRLLLSWPGTGRSVALRLILVPADLLATVPIGMLAAIASGRRSLAWIMTMGLLVATTVAAVSIFVLSTSPSVASIGVRTLGIVVGANLINAVGRLPDLEAWPQRCARFVPVIACLYVLFVIVVNDLASRHWLGIREALANVDPLGLLPLWHYYIVSKSQAVESVVAHALCYGPIGVMIWLRRGNWPGNATMAAILGFVLSFAVEAARGMKPGLQPDINNIFVAVVAAALSAQLAPPLWRLLEEMRAGMVFAPTRAAFAKSRSHVR